MFSIPKAVVVTTFWTSPWLHDCLASLKGCGYPVLVCMNTVDDNGYDPAGLYFAKEHKLEEFVLIHDSTIVTDNTLIRDLFSKEGFVPIAPDGLMLMGKYVTKDLPELPAKPKTKRQAVDFELSYKTKVPWNHPCAEPKMVDNPEREIKHDAIRMVIRGDKLIKWKGCWDISMVKDD